MNKIILSLLVLVSVLICHSLATSHMQFNRECGLPIHRIVISVCI